MASSWHLRSAGRVFAQGGVVVCPTEGVFGLHSRFDDRDAVYRVLQAKDRTDSKGLIILVNSLSQIEHLLDIHNLDAAIWEATWPGPVTWILPASRHAPRWLTGGQTGLAVRQSAFPLLRRLVDIAGPLVSTSANRSGRSPARTVLQARRYFPRGVDYFVPGKLGGATGPTEIRDAVSGTVLRKGG